MDGIKECQVRAQSVLETLGQKELYDAENWRTLHQVLTAVVGSVLSGDLQHQLATALLSSQSTSKVVVGQGEHPEGGNEWERVLLAAIIELALRDHPNAAAQHLEELLLEFGFNPAWEAALVSSFSQMDQINQDNCLERLLNAFSCNDYTQKHLLVSLLGKLLRTRRSKQQEIPPNLDSILSLGRDKTLLKPFLERIVPELCRGCYAQLTSSFLVDIATPILKNDAQDTIQSIELIVLLFEACGEESAVQEKFLPSLLSLGDLWDLLLAALSLPSTSLAHKTGLYLLESAVGLGAAVSDPSWETLVDLYKGLAEMEIQCLRKTWTACLNTLCGPCFNTSTKTGAKKTKSGKKERGKLAALFSVPVSFSSSWLEPCLCIAFQHPNPEFRLHSLTSYLETMTSASNSDGVLQANLCSPTCLVSFLATPENVNSLVRGPPDEKQQDRNRFLLATFLSDWLATKFERDSVAAQTTLFDLFQSALAQFSVPYLHDAGLVVLDVMHAVDTSRLANVSLDDVALSIAVSACWKTRELCMDPVFSHILPTSLARIDDLLARFQVQPDSLTLGSVAAYLSVLIDVCGNRGSVVWPFQKLMDHAKDDLVVQNAKPLALIWAASDCSEQQLSFLLHWCRVWATQPTLALAEWMMHAFRYATRFQSAYDALHACEESQQLISQIARSLKDPSLKQLQPTIMKLLAQVSIDAHFVPDNLQPLLSYLHTASNSFDGCTLDSVRVLAVAFKNSQQGQLQQQSSVAELPKILLQPDIASSDVFVLRHHLVLCQNGLADSRTSISLAKGIFNDPSAEYEVCKVALEITVCCLVEQQFEADEDLLNLLVSIVESRWATGETISLAAKSVFCPTTIRAHPEFVRDRAWKAFFSNPMGALIMLEELLFTTLPGATISVDSHVPWLELFAQVIVRGGDDSVCQQVSQEFPSIGFCLPPSEHKKLLVLRFIESWTAKEPQDHRWLVSLAHILSKHLFERSTARTSCLQALCVISLKAKSFNDEETLSLFNTLVDHDFESFKEDSLNRYYLELAVTSLVLTNPALMVPHIMEEMKSLSMGVEKEVSLIPVVGSLVLSLEKYNPTYLEQHCTLFDEIACTLLPYTASMSVAGREVSQWVLHRFYSLNKESSSMDPRIRHLGEFLEQSSVSVKSRKRITRRLEQYIPWERCCVSYFFNELVSKHPYRRWLVSWFSEGFNQLCSVTFKRTEEDSKSSSLIAIPENTPPRAFRAIVLGSLVYKVPNAAGLTRTCDLFSVQELVLGRSFTHERDFASMACSSECWMPTRVVASADIPEFIAEQKARGYAIVALEQSASSVNITDYQFPHDGRVVFLLGTEKEGIASHLLRLVDVCIEIPQFGVTRSLNVHASCSLLLWEYAKQQKFTSN